MAKKGNVVKKEEKVVRKSTTEKKQEVIKRLDNALLNKAEENQIVVRLKAGHPTGARRRAGFIFRTKPTLISVTKDQLKEIQEDKYLLIITKGTAYEQAMSGEVSALDEEGNKSNENEEGNKNEDEGNNEGEELKEEGDKNEDLTAEEIEKSKVIEELEKAHNLVEGKDFSKDASLEDLKIVLDSFKE